MSDWCFAPSQQFSMYIMARTNNISTRRRCGPRCTIQTRLACIDSAISRKQQSVGRYIALFGHIIPIPSQKVFTVILI